MKKNLLGLILLVSSSAFSQWNSVDFSMSFVTDLNQQDDMFQVKINPNLLDSIGRVTVMIYHSE